MSMSKALNQVKTFVDAHEQAHRDANEERINVAMDHTINAEIADRGSETLQENAPTLASSAMLVEVNISQWTARKKDDQATKTVIAAYNAKQGVGGFHKKLLADNQNLKAIAQHVTAIRDTHARMTMPWSNSGLRLLPTAQYFKYNQVLTDMQNEFERLVKEFLNEYEDAVIDVQIALGDLFSRDEYPSVDEIVRKFRFTISYMPLPDAGDFRVDIGNEALNEVKEQYNKFYTEQYGRAMNDVWTRLHKYLKKMSERLDYTTGEDKKIFRDTLVSNVTEMIELLRVCNVTNSSQMSAMADRLEEAMSGVTPDALREDDYFRAETKAAVDKAIAKLPSLDI